MNIEIPEIPHGHGLSFKRGVADALLETESHKNTCHGTHAASYLKGYKIGGNLKELIAKKVSA